MVNLPRQGLWLSPGGASIELGNIPQPQRLGNIPQLIFACKSITKAARKKITFSQKKFDHTLFFCHTKGRLRLTITKENHDRKTNGIPT